MVRKESVVSAGPRSPHDPALERARVTPSHFKELGREHDVAENRLARVDARGGAAGLAGEEGELVEVDAHLRASERAGDEIEGGRARGE